MTAAIRTRGQPAAEAALRAFAAGRTPHAILLVGPESTGKTTLALDLATMLLCEAPDPADRPCGRCRGCRMVASGNHPDLHRLAPEGPGGQVGIGQVRALGGALALLPVEGGARVAIVETAHRLNDDAQNALLKTLEEPPAGATIVLCADAEERLLPTVRSRCARVRLGPVATREIEALVEGLGVADRPTAARSARLAAGRPGLAVAYARSPAAALARAEVARTLLDLLDAGPADRLRAIRAALRRADEAATALAADPPAPAVAETTRGRGRSRATAPSRRAAAPVAPDDAPDSPPAAEPDTTPTRPTAAARRRAAGWLIDTWRDLGRDLAVLEIGEPTRVRDVGLLEELSAAVPRLEPGSVGHFLGRLVRASEELDANASPELLLDVLVLAWPRARPAA